MSITPTNSNRQSASPAQAKPIGIANLRSVAESSGSTSDGVDSSGSSGDSTSDGSGTTDGTTGDTSGTTGQLECEQCISDAEANVCADEFGACGNDQYCGEIGSCCLATPDACDECGCEAFESSGDAWNAYAACIEDVCAGCGPAQCGV